MKKANYPNNIYIQNHEEVKAQGGDINVCLDKYDNAHGLKHDALARAQYKHWRAVETGVPELLSVASASCSDCKTKKPPGWAVN